MPGPGKVCAAYPDLGGVRPMQGTPEAPAESCRNQGLQFNNKFSLTGVIYVNT